MDQSRTRKVIVNEGRIGTDAPETKPEEDELMAVHKVQGNNLLWPDVVCGLEPIAVLQDYVIRLSVGP